MADRQFDDIRAKRAERIRRFVERAQHFRFSPACVLAVKADPKSANTRAQAFRVIGNRFSSRRGVTCIVTGEHLQRKGAIFHASGHRSGMITAVEARENAFQADSSIRRLQANDSA